MKPKILIIGAGFAGIFAAKKLYELLMDEAEITLVSPSDHFEFHANLYKVVTDRSPLQACIPLQRIFQETTVNIVNDYIIQFDPKNNTALGKSEALYHFDYAVLALGSQNADFGIKGISNYAHSFRSIDEALRLSRHIHDLLHEKAENNDHSQSEIIIVGAGPTGVELAGELAQHLKKLTRIHKLPSDCVQIQLIEATDRILSFLPENESKIIHKQLEHLGVQIKTNAKVNEEIPTGIVVNNNLQKTTTVIWTAGVKPNARYQTWGLTTATNGRAVVNKFLQSQDNSHIFIAGDGADVVGTGTAWPAADQGITAAINIYNSIDKHHLEEYKPQKYPIIIPVGPNWALAKLPNQHTITGKSAWLYRQWHILEFFLKILPLSEAIATLKSGGEMCSVCSECQEYDHHLAS